MNAMTTSDRRSGSHRESSWSPIMLGREADEVVAAVRAIRAELLNRPERQSMAPSPNDPDMARANLRSRWEAASLHGGDTGLGLMYYYTSAIESEPSWSNAARAIERAMEIAAHTSLPLTLWSGIWGVAWAAEHLSRESEGLSYEPNDEIDQLVLEVMQTAGPQLHYDLLRGLVGAGVYALERLPSPSARRALELIVRELERRAVKRDRGLSWFTSASTLTKFESLTTPDGFFCLGVAHGVPGVIAFLAQAWAAGVLPETSSALLRGGLDWLKGERNSLGSSCCFPGMITESGKIASRPLGWCYGDTGLAAALLTAAKALSDEALADLAIDIALEAASRDHEASGIHEACLCHGSAGVAHSFNRLYQGTGVVEFREAARYWIRDTLSRRHAGVGIAGFVSRVEETEGELTWRGCQGLLDGVAGIALALCATVSPAEPRWDRLFLASSAIYPTSVERQR